MKYQGKVNLIKEIKLQGLIKIQVFMIKSNISEIFFFKIESKSQTFGKLVSDQSQFKPFKTIFIKTESKSLKLLKTESRSWFESTRKSLWVLSGPNKSEIGFANWDLKFPHYFVYVAYFEANLLVYLVFSNPKRRFENHCKDLQV